MTPATLLWITAVARPSGRCPVVSVSRHCANAPRLSTKQSLAVLAWVAWTGLGGSTGMVAAGPNRAVASEIAQEPAVRRAEGVHDARLPPAPSPRRATLLVEAPTLSAAEIRLMLTRIVVGVVCGGCIGLERWAAGASAGFRTTSLTALGSSVFTLTAMLSCPRDTARVLAQIVSGVGFIGAGCISTSGYTQRKGLSTATGIWISAAIGAASAFGLYSLAISASILTVTILRYANWKAIVGLQKRSMQKRIKRASIPEEPNEQKDKAELNHFDPLI